MAKTNYQKLEEMAEKIDGESTLKALIFHSQSVHDDIVDEMKEAELAGHKRMIRLFNHYHKVMMNIIGYMYSEQYNDDEKLEFGGPEEGEEDKERTPE